MRENWYRDVWLLLISAVVAWSLLAADAERARRADQTCLLFERDYERNVMRLANTYSYLVALGPRERDSSLNRTVLAQLPDTEGAARTSKAPAYCDAPGVGLPEPNPRLPERPPILR